jgi:hypothetical protein
MNIACHEGKFEDLVFEHEHANENIVYLETWQKQKGMQFMKHCLRGVCLED